MFSEAHIEFIETQIAEKNTGKKPQRTFVTELDGVKILVKAQEKSKPRWRSWMLQFFAVLFREPLLKPTRVPGAADTQAMELKRLKDLTAVGAPVPKIVHEAKNWFALAYLPGYNLRVFPYKEKNIAPSLYFEKTLAAILDVHQKGQSLSQAFNRNVMWSDERIVFIDFEDEPASYLGMGVAQARDWLYFLFSCVWMQEISTEEVTAMVWKYVQQDAPEVKKALLHTGSTIGWLRHLPKERKPWGRDIMSMHRWGEILYGLQKLGEAEAK
ncbi:MAG: hypothetical protein WAU37_06240 [Formosimonas sp.]